MAHLTKSIGIATFAALAWMCPAANAQTASLDDVLAQVAKWDFDQPREPLIAMAGLMANAKNSPAQLREIEQRLAALLGSGAPPGARDFMCKQLSVMGTDISVPALSALLVKPETTDTARYALERIPGPAAGRALEEAVPKLSGKARLGVINSLGRRREPSAVAALRPLASNADPAIASATLFALAAIADSAAVQALAEAHASAGGGLHSAAAAAYLEAADRLAISGAAASALPIYRKLYAASETSTIRAGALRGLAGTGGTQAVPELVAALRSEDPRLQAVAVRALAQTAPAQLAAELPKLNEAGQVRILGTLSERGDISALPAFTAALKAPGKPVRLAALEGIGRVGNASVVTPLAAMAASGDEAEQKAARAGLDSLRGADVDQAIAAGIAGAGPKAKLELIRAAGERGTAAAAPTLLQMARGGDAELRRESLRALRDTASSSDISGLVALVVSPVQPSDRAEAVRSLAAVLRRSEPSGIQQVVAAYTPASDAEARSGLLQVMGQSGNAEALRILRGALQDANPDLKRAAILALGEWPDDAPIADLLKTSRASTTQAHQVLALRSAVRLIGRPGTARSPGETVRMLADAMRLARQADEKRSVLALLPRFPSRDALDLARASLNDSEVGAEAKAAVNRLERTVGR
jgi:HEAT repeat protein